MKEAGMRIRIESELREAFVSICRNQDLPASQVLRAFMRDYVQRNQSPSRAKPAAGTPKKK
jgi:antitoxin component of RelBE/YafQ-DinJ toxin-antitoxin module